SQAVALGDPRDRCAVQIGAEENHPGYFLLSNVAKDIRPLPGITIPPVAAAPGHRHRGRNELKNRLRSRDSFEQPFLLCLAEHRSVFSIAILPRVQYEKLERLAPSERPRDRFGFFETSPYRPIVQERFPTYGRQRVSRQVVVGHFVIVPSDIRTDLIETKLGGSIVAVGAIFRPELG